MFAREDLVNTPLILVCIIKIIYLSNFRFIFINDLCMYLCVLYISYVAIIIIIPARIPSTLCTVFLSEYAVVLTRTQFRSENSRTTLLCRFMSQCSVSLWSSINSEMRALVWIYESLLKKKQVKLLGYHIFNSLLCYQGLK